MPTVLNGVLDFATGAYLKNAHIQQVATLPAWASADEGRLVYAQDTDKLYVGDDAGWIDLSQVLTAGDGVDLVSDAIIVDVTDFIDTAAGLMETTNNIQVRLESNGGIQFDGVNGGLELKPDSTTGVTVAPLTVGTNGAGVTVDNDSLKHTTGTLAVKADGIDETHVDWGSGANQVDATSVPVDSGGTYAGAATTVQDALEELEAAIGAASAAFVTIDCPSGTDPVATSGSDTLTFAAGSTAITITGNSATDTVTYDLALNGTFSGLEVSSGLRIAASAAGDGLIGGATTALAVGAGDGIDVAADSVAVDVTDFIDTAAGLMETTNNIQVRLESNGGIQFDGVNGGLELKPDVTTGATVAQLTVGTNGAGVSVDNLTLGHVSGTLEIKDGGVDSDQIASGSVDGAHLSTSAKTSVLQYKLYPGWDQVSNLATGTGLVTTVNTEVNSAATVDTPETSFTNAKGVYTGYVTGELPIRDSSTNDPVDDGAGNEVYGRLTNKYYSSGLSNITGVTIGFVGQGAVSGQSLVYTNTGTTLAWDGGTPVNVGTNGRYILEGSAGKSAGTDYMVVSVVAASLPGSNQSDAITLATGYRLGYFSNVADVETPYQFGITDTVDFLFIEVFDLDSIPASALLNGVAFGDILSITSHNHDDRYYTETEVGAVGSGNPNSTSGASKVGTDASAIGSNAGSTDTVQGVLEAFDTALEARTKLYSNTYTSSTSWTVTHSLGTTDVMVSVWDAGSPRSQVIPDQIEATNTNTVTITFASAQAGKAVVIGY